MAPTCRWNLDRVDASSSNMSTADCMMAYPSRCRRFLSTLSTRGNSVPTGEDCTSYIGVVSVVSGYMVYNCVYYCDTIVSIIVIREHQSV
jgi:hypothetical protein